MSAYKFFLECLRPLDRDRMAAVFETLQIKLKYLSDDSFKPLEEYYVLYMFLNVAKPIGFEK